MKKCLLDIRRIYFKILSIFKRRYYTSKLKSNLSDSEKSGLYTAEVRRILSSQKLFNNFKRNFFYTLILEHVNYLQGEEYLFVLRKRSDNVLKTALESILKTDSIGNPFKFKYKEGLISPSTIRYVKVSSDLRMLFGTSLISIAEIGCGYGGQTLASNQLNNYLNFTLFDLDDVNKLVKRYLNNFILNGSFNTTTINEFLGGQKFDLVISNYAFSELPKDLQKKYIEKVIIHSEKGYLTMNSGLYGSNLDDKMSLEEIREYIPNLEIYSEEPKTGPNNYILVWGNSGKLENQIILNQSQKSVEI